jgi:hypothetical protein
VVQDLVIRPQVVNFRRERWQTPDGEMMTPPLPAGIDGHFGPQLRRFVLAQYHPGQVTVPGLLALLRGVGILIPERQVVRLLIAGQDSFLAENRDVLRAGLSSTAWVTVDDTGARHKAANGVRSQIGNAHFAWFGTTNSKSRCNFLQVLRAGHSDYVITAVALPYMRQRSLAGPVIARLAEHPDNSIADQAVFAAHLDQLGISALKVNPDPVLIPPRAPCGAASRRMACCPTPSSSVTTPVSSMSAGTALLDACRAPRSQARHLHQCAAPGPGPNTHPDLAVLRRSQAYRQHLSKQRKAALRARFDRIFKCKTGFVTLDRLLARLHANKRELMMVLDRPEIPLRTNGSENDIRCQVTRRKVSGGTCSDVGCDCRDAFFGLATTCAKLGITFWDYLGARLAVPSSPVIPCYLKSSPLTSARPERHDFCPSYRFFLIASPIQPCAKPSALARTSSASHPSAAETRRLAISSQFCSASSQSAKNHDGSSESPRA